MQLIIDENIPFADEFFSSVTSQLLIKVPGRNLAAQVDRSVLAKARALIIRSVTRVDNALLDLCPNLTFVGTCTIGTDHIDMAACADRNIEVVSAPGCNANSVVEYVFSALAALGVDWRQKTVGIIGCGNVGGALFRRLQGLRVACKVYDPLLDLSAADSQYHAAVAAARVNDIHELLDCDIVSLHTPLTTSGPYPSKHLLGYAELKQLRYGSVLLNAGRGPVIDNRALLRRLQECKDLQVVLDVWEMEPVVSLPLMDLVALATPHIAGYSFDGKAAGTAMIYAALCEHLQVPQSVLLAAVLPAYNGAELTLPVDTQLSDNNLAELINHIILQAYNIREDDISMRKALQQAAINASGVAQAFDQLRKNYSVRREFPCFRFSAELTETVRAHGLQPLLRNLGFA